MKTLLLMRHAKSSWKDSELADHERPLNKRGRLSAPLMGHVLAEHELVPQRIISSSALRARQTAEAVAASSGYGGDITYLDELYQAEVEAYVDAVREMPNEMERILVIGHNPTLDMLLQLLTGQIIAMPTAGMAHLALPISHWNELSVDTEADLLDLWQPKEMLEPAGGATKEEHTKTPDKGKKSKSKNKDKSKKKGK